MIDTLNDLKQLVVQAAAEKKAFDILVMDLRERSDLTDFFVICSATSRMQVQAITDSILDQVYESPHKFSSREGYTSGNWVVLDLCICCFLFICCFFLVLQKTTSGKRLWPA